MSVQFKPIGPWASGWGRPLGAMQHADILGEVVLEASQQTTQASQLFRPTSLSKQTASQTDKPSKHTRILVYIQVADDCKGIKQEAGDVGMDIDFFEDSMASEEGTREKTVLDQQRRPLHAKRPKPKLRKSCDGCEITTWDDDPVTNEIDWKGTANPEPAEWGYYSPHSPEIPMAASWLMSRS